MKTDYLRVANLALAAENDVHRRTMKRIETILAKPEIFPAHKAILILLEVSGQKPHLDEILRGLGLTPVDGSKIQQLLDWLAKTGAIKRSRNGTRVESIRYAAKIT